MSLRANVDSLARNPDVPPEERARVLADVRSELALDALQELARGDARVTESYAGVDLAELADAAVDSLHPAPSWRSSSRRPLAASRSRAPAPVSGSCSTTSWRTPAATAARVRVEIEQVNGGGRVVVDDDGPGIPDKLLDRVFERFSTLQPRPSAPAWAWRSLPSRRGCTAARPGPDGVAARRRAVRGRLAADPLAPSRVVRWPGSMDYPLETFTDDERRTSRPTSPTSTSRCSRS